MVIKIYIVYYLGCFTGVLLFVGHCVERYSAVPPPFHRYDPQPDEYEAYGIDFDPNVPRTKAELEEWERQEEECIEQRPPLNMNDFKIKCLPHFYVREGEYDPFTDPREECKFPSIIHRNQYF